MASGRFGGPPDLKGTLGTLLRTTLYQVSAVKDAALREAQNRRGWIDGAVLARRRKDALAHVGEAIVALAAAGALGDLEDVPEIRQALAEVDELDAQIAEADERAHHAGADSARGSVREPEGEVRVWRPVVPDDAELESEDAEPRPARKAAHADRPRRRAVRTGGGIHFVDDEPLPGDPDSDDDLAAYMNDDDVPGSEDR